MDDIFKMAFIYSEYKIHQRIMLYNLERTVHRFVATERPAIRYYTKSPSYICQHCFGITLLSGLVGMDRTTYMSFNKTKITYMVATIKAIWKGLNRERKVRSTGSSLHKPIVDWYNY